MCAAFAASTFFAYCHMVNGDVKVDFSSGQFQKGFHDMCHRFYGTAGTSGGLARPGHPAARLPRWFGVRFRRREEEHPRRRGGHAEEGE